jgi:hypothetical protein
VEALLIVYLSNERILWFTISLAIIFDNACRYHGFNGVVSEAASTMYGNGNLVHAVHAAGVVMDIECIVNKNVLKSCRH